MQLQGLWLVLAGFVLGFALSTLWEWLYYRRQRWLNHPQLIYTPPPSDFEVSAFEEENLAATAIDERLHPAYRSPGIFLESEEDGTYAAAEARRAIVEPAVAEQIALQPNTRQNIAQPNLPRLTTSADDDEDVAAMFGLPPAPFLEPDPAAEEPAIITVASALNQLSSATDQPDQLPQSNTSSPETAAFAPAPNTNIATNIAVEPARIEGIDSQILPPQPDPPTFLSEPTLPVTPQRSVSVPPPLPLPPLYSGLGLRASDYPDDLAKIFGIGEVYKQRLYAAGIFTWQQVADSDVESLRRITHAKPNADIANWQTQARSLVKRFNRMGALYHGPPPDQLTDIEGIGPTVRDALYRAGISTYAQLAKTSAATLAQILPAPTIGTTYHFDDWLEEATRRAPPQV